MRCNIERRILNIYYLRCREPWQILYRGEPPRIAYSLTEVSGLGLPHESTGRASVASTIVHSKEYYRDLRIRTHASGHEIETEFRQVFLCCFCFVFWHGVVLIQVEHIGSRNRKRGWNEQKWRSSLVAFGLVTRREPPHPEWLQTNTGPSLAGRSH